MNYNNFEREIQYKSVIDYSDKSSNAQKRAAVLTMHGDIYIQGRIYTVFLTYHLNSKEKLSLYHNSFLSLNDGLDYTIVGPTIVLASIKPFESKKGKGQASFEKTLAKISESYGLSRYLGVEISTKLYSDATDYFYEWKDNEIEKIWPTKKPFDFKLNTVSYSGVDCVMHATLTHGNDYDVMIKLFPKDNDWYLGLNTWDLVGKVSVEVVDVCRFTAYCKDIQPKINFHFQGLMENFPRFKGMLADMLDEQSKNWKDWYIKNVVDKKAKTEWSHDFMMPFMYGDGRTVYGNATVKVTFDKDYLNTGVGDYFSQPRARIAELRNEFGGLMLKNFITGDLNLKAKLGDKEIINISKCDLKPCEIEENLERNLDVDSYKQVYESFTEYLFDNFYDKWFLIPLNTQRILRELGATEEQISKVEMDFRRKS